MTPLPPVVAQIKLRVIVGDLIFDLDEMDDYRPLGCEAFPEIDHGYETPQAAAHALETYYNSLTPAPAGRRRRTTKGATR